jgi:hypothetical protein
MTTPSKVVSPILRPLTVEPAFGKERGAAVRATERTVPSHITFGT